MAKNIYICSKNKFQDSIDIKLREICKRLEPDNICSKAARIVVGDDIAYGVENPPEDLLENGNSLLMGQILDKDEDWGIPGKKFPDGTYALFRNDQNYVEIVSDYVASRTIWYFFDENTFVAATSQRAIIMFIGSYEFDKRLIPWMLATGSLGPSYSWDKRIKRVASDSSVMLNKKDWSITIHQNPIEFNIVNRSDEHHENVLVESLKATFNSLNLDFSYWSLPLSGGYDSRGILCLLKDSNKDLNKLKSITWGLESSLRIKENDAYVAKKLAAKLNVPNKYFTTDLSEESPNKIINRFVILGEGRIDHISAYMDGFHIWKTLFEDGIQGIIRGDEGFGWMEVSSSLTVRMAVGCRLCSDIYNLEEYSEEEFLQQEFPQILNQRKDESISQWRDRLYHAFRIPTILAALSDLKLAYVEQINPLLSKRILQTVRELPDHLRTNKALFRKIVISLSPDIEFANSDAHAKPKDILRQSKIVKILKIELDTEEVKKLFPTNFLNDVLKGLVTEGLKAKKTKSSLIRSVVSKLLPRFLKNIVRDKFSLPKEDYNRLAFRILLINRMNKILNDDKLMN